MDRSVDVSDLRSVILNSVNQLQEKFEIHNFSGRKKAPGEYSELIVNGMGGSALPAEIILSGFFQLSDNQKLAPIFIHRSYGASRRLGENSLVVSISYSGNTEETVSAYKASLRQGVPSIAIAAGGELIKLAQEYNQPYVVLPQPDEAFQPRYATFYMMKALVTVLSTYGILAEDMADRLVENFAHLDPEDFEEQGKTLATKLHTHTPVVYSTNAFSKASHIWKIKMNENAKTPCFHNNVPELNHNEMVGFTNPQCDFSFVFLRSEAETSRNVTRLETMKTIFEERGLPVHEVRVQDHGNYLANLMAMILVGDWTAYYSALAYGIDPTPVDLVEDFKTRLKQQSG